MPNTRTIDLTDNTYLSDAQWNRIALDLEPDPNAQVINCEMSTTLVVEVDHVAVFSLAEVIVSRHRLFQQVRIQHQQHSFS